MIKRDILPEVKKPAKEEPVEINHKEEEEIFKLPETPVEEPVKEEPAKPKRLDVPRETPVEVPPEKPKRQRRQPTEKQLEALRISRETRARIRNEKKGKTPEEKLKEEEMQQLKYLEEKYRQQIPEQPKYQPPAFDYSQIPKTEIDYDRIINGVTAKYQAFHTQQEQERQKKQQQRTQTIDLLSGRSRKGQTNRVFQQTSNIRSSFGNKHSSNW